MLDASFYETPDYKALIESAEKSIVVGRRGTGKSALAYWLGKDYGARSATLVLSYAPEDFETTAIRHNLRALGQNYNLAKSASKLITKFALYLEILGTTSSHFKFAQLDDVGFVNDLLRQWRACGQTAFERIAATLATHIKPGVPPEAIVGGLATTIQIRRLEKFANGFLSFYDTTWVLLFDRLDEGYEHDTLGIAFIAGIAEIINQFNVSYQNHFRSLVFIRDNIAVR